MEREDFFQIFLEEMNQSLTNVEIPDKILANRIQQHIKK